MDRFFLASACFFINRVHRTGPFSCNNQNYKTTEKRLTKGEGMKACVFEKYGRIIAYRSLNKCREKLGEIFINNFGKTGAGDEKKSHSLHVLIFYFPF